MAGLRRTRAVCVLILLVFLASDFFGQTTPLLRVDEHQIRFRLNSHPVLELPIVNPSDKTLTGDFMLASAIAISTPTIDHRSKCC